MRGELPTLLRPGAVTSFRQVEGDKTASAGTGGEGRREWTPLQVDRRSKTGEEGGELGA